jgi:hypothetical protein
MQNETKGLQAGGFFESNFSPPQNLPNKSVVPKSHDVIAARMNNFLRFIPGLHSRIA